MQVLIIGAGIGGLSASISISLSTAHSVLVLEQASALREAGAGIQVPPNASKILTSWGLGDEIARVAVTPEAFRLRGWKDGRVLSEQPLEDACSGGDYWHVHRADLHAVLVRRARELGVASILPPILSL
jgi:salicylate hydroxylase